jgi:tRNA threonylcarbamoyl adenosine modification protein (Sua5/YciO/YrdC/YwlC family)
MSERFDCTDPAQLAEGLQEAQAALRRGQLVVLPTDTVYGIAAEAFDPIAVDRLLAAKGRGRDMPPPVLVGTVRAAIALIQELNEMGKDLIDEFWPGGLTLIFKSSPTLVWDIGETKGTVAIRMPLHAVALGLLKKTGPLAVSSANYSGQPPATTADEAVAQLGDSVAVYLDGGSCAGDVPSTIVDLTGSVPRLLRPGVIPPDRLREVVPLIDADAFAPDPAEREDPVIPDETDTPDSTSAATDAAPAATGRAAAASGSEPGKVANVPGDADESDGGPASELTADQNSAAPEGPGQVL